MLFSTREIRERIEKYGLTLPYFAEASGIPVTSLRRVMRTPWADGRRMAQLSEVSLWKATDALLLIEAHVNKVGKDKGPVEAFPAAAEAARFMNTRKKRRRR